MSTCVCTQHLHLMLQTWALYEVHGIDAYCCANTDTTGDIEEI